MHDNTPRLLFMDNLRAVIALLGIPLHAAWLISMTQNTNSVFNIITLFIHMFRLPIYFLIAGFFAHKLYRNLGILDFIKNRLWRIGIPFVSILTLSMLPIYLFFTVGKALAANNFMRALKDTTAQQFHSGFLTTYFNHIQTV